MNSHVVLVGMMGCGKSLIGRKLADQRGIPFYDVDGRIEEEAGCSISDLFEKEGEVAFRRMESDIILQLLAAPAGVMATGGGAFIQSALRKRLLEEATCIYLKTSPEVLWGRVRGESHRPLLKKENPEEVLRDLLAKRESFYSLAPVTVETDGKAPEQIVGEIILIMEEKKMKVGLIGVGKMGMALAQGMIKAGVVGPSALSGCDKMEAARHAFERELGELGALFYSDPVELVEKSDLIILAIKPQQFHDLLFQIKRVSGGKLFLSIAAGISIQTLEQGLDANARVVRAMPNTPALVGCGMTVYAPGHKATEEDLRWVEILLKAVGKTARSEESKINAVTALSGSGPAYFFHLIEALIQGGVEQGLSRELSRQLAVQTALGSARMLEELHEEPLELAAKVKSPGGTTIAGCEVMEKEDVEGAMRRAVAAARKRADELGKQAK